MSNIKDFPEILLKYSSSIDITDFEDMHFDAFDIFTLLLCLLPLSSLTYRDEFCQKCWTYYELKEN